MSIQLKKHLNLFQKAELKTFGIVYYYDHFIVPEDSIPILFINSKRIQIPWDNFISEIHQKLESEFKSYELLKNDEKYWDFNNAENYYFRQLEKTTANIGFCASGADSKGSSAVNRCWALVRARRNATGH